MRICADNAKNREWGLEKLIYIADMLAAKLSGDVVVISKSEDIVLQWLACQMVINGAEVVYISHTLFSPDEK